MAHRNIPTHLLRTLGMIITIQNVVKGGQNSEVHQEPLYKIKDEDKFPSFNLQLVDNTFDDLVSTLKDWSLVHGDCSRSRKHFSLDTVMFQSFTLFPSPFPRSEYEKAMKIQSSMNLLYHKIAHDHEFLKSSLENTMEVDEFTKKLFDIYETVRKEGLAQIPENKALHGLSTAVIKAWEHYKNPKAIVLMIVEEVEENICNQRKCEFAIYRNNPEITVLRRTIDEIAARGRLNEKREFFVDDMEVAVAYYRTGYMPKQYVTEKHWQVRLDIERSKAIKCPSIGLQLAGTKKVQQALALKNAVSRFLPDDEAEAINEVFTGLYSLDLNPEGDEAVEMALKNPELYVLKPQREGGGNNFFGEDILKVLLPIKNSKERTAYILMRRIMPPSTQNYLVVPEIDKKPVKKEVVSELGILGQILGSKDKIEMNNNYGSFMRTKNLDSNEAGISAGLGGNDTVFLF